MWRGGAVSSQAALIADKVQIEKVVAEIDTRVVNTSMQGVLLKRTEVRSLKEIIECELKPQTDVSQILDGLDWKSSIARRSMMKYLMLVPDDREILALRDVIYTLDEEESFQLIEESREKEKQILSEPQLLHKAQSYLNVGDAEPAIGILEGLSCTNGEKSVSYREKIGDIRLHQKDLRSALWHYRHIFTDEILLPKMQGKIAQLKLEADRE